MSIVAAHHSSSMFAHSGHFFPWRNTCLACHEGLLGSWEWLKPSAEHRPCPSHCSGSHRRWRNKPHSGPTFTLLFSPQSTLSHSILTICQVVHHQRRCMCIYVSIYDACLSIEDEQGEASGYFHPLGVEEKNTVDLSLVAFMFSQALAALRRWTSLMCILVR